MSLVINQTIDTKDGFTVPSGTIVRFSTTFPDGVYEAHMNMKFYKDQETIDNGLNNYFPLLLESMGYTKTYTENEFTGLTPTQIHIDLKSYLETIFTGGTIDIAL